MVLKTYDIEYLTCFEAYYLHLKNVPTH